MAQETQWETQKALLDECENNIRMARSIMSTTRGMCPELSDDLLAALVKDGYTQTEIAQRWHKSQSAISRRVARIYGDSKLPYEKMVSSDPMMNSLTNPFLTAEAGSKLWDIKTSYEQNYVRLLGAYNGSLSGHDRIRALAEIRKHVDASHHVMKDIYSMERVRKFVDDVIDIVGQCDKRAQTEIRNALKSRRGELAQLAAFLERADKAELDG
ncbi:MAG TPA: hypothetical protein VGK19_25890 [Capsulimonadaceae bacterium]|jgi:hypothetical protein